MLDFGSLSRKDIIGTNNDVTKVLPVKIRIGEKTKVHAIDALSQRSDDAIGYKYSKENNSSGNKKRINNLAIIFFPLIILCFNVVYFLLTT